MKLTSVAAMFCSFMPVAALGQAARSISPAPVYSTTSTDIGTLLDNPATKAVLVKDIPEIVNNEQINMARSMTLKGIQQYAGDAISDAKLAAIDKDLAAIPAKP